MTPQLTPDLNARLFTRLESRPVNILDTVILGVSLEFKTAAPGILDKICDGMLSTWIIMLAAGNEDFKGTVESGLLQAYYAVPSLDAVQFGAYRGA